MGCPDAVRVELLKVTGVLGVTYHPAQDRFAVRFESVLANQETILATIAAAGKMMAKIYRPYVMPPEAKGS
jgi:hypothetical protein